jgi:hypothetical protein
MGSKRTPHFSSVYRSLGDLNRAFEKIHERERERTSQGSQQQSDDDNSKDTRKESDDGTHDRQGTR